MVLCGFRKCFLTLIFIKCDQFKSYLFGGCMLLIFCSNDGSKHIVLGSSSLWFEVRPDDTNDEFSNEGFGETSWELTEHMSNILVRLSTIFLYIKLNVYLHNILHKL